MSLLPITLAASAACCAAGSGPTHRGAPPTTGQVSWSRMNGEFEGRVALVAGAAQGIGHGTDSCLPARSALRAGSRLLAR